MKARPALLRALALSALLGASWGAQAQAFRTYLASNGVDNANCSRPAPCRLLPAALAAVADGGEVWILDSANYNTAPVNVTKSVTILAVPGALGSVVATGGSAFNLGTPGIKVALRNLVIVPLPAAGATNGISVGAAAQLTVDNCSISNLPGHGILVVGNTRVNVTNTVVRDNGDVGIWLLRGARATIVRSTLSGNGSAGVFVIGDFSDTLTTADIAASTLDGNANGLLAWSEAATATVRVSVRDSRLVGNVGAGASALSSQLGGGSVSLSASSNIVSNNAIGLEASQAGARIWAAGNTISANGTGFNNVSATIETAGNNALRHNGTDSTGGVSNVGLF